MYCSIAINTEQRSIPHVYVFVNDLFYIFFRVTIKYVYFTTTESQREGCVKHIVNRIQTDVVERSYVSGPIFECHKMYRTSGCYKRRVIDQ